MCVQIDKNLKVLTKMKIQNKKDVSRQGFTLIELLVVIAIIGLLSSVVLLSLNSAREKARNARRAADVRQIIAALELYYDAQTSSFYPVSASVKTDLTPFLATWPVYPVPAGTGCSQTDYEYAQAGSGVDYTLTFCVSQATGAFAAGTHTASRAGLQ